MPASLPHKSGAELCFFQCKTASRASSQVKRHHPALAKFGRVSIFGTGATLSRRVEVRTKGPARRISPISDVVERELIDVFVMRP
jgi:hypothetical protein